ncbi:MAG: DUF3710 domain-containing protein [Kineosporiaceae bacterium]|nr:DUF3710 domain-containing protein [Aeromicrobium sp.]
MRIRRKKSTDVVAEKVVADDLGEVETVAAEISTDPRAGGPWDSSEKSPDGDETYIDLGSLIIKGRAGFNLQLPTDGDSDEIGSAVLMTEDSGLELRAFAAARSGGLWDEVRADLIDEVERLGGNYLAVDGAFGSELQIRVPVTLPDGEEGFQPSRIIGVEGPRWLLRGTLLGDAALNPTDEGLLLEAFRETIVVRGSDPKAPREPLLIAVPAGAVVLGDETGAVKHT